MIESEEKQNLRSEHNMIRRKVPCLGTMKDVEGREAMGKKVKKKRCG